MFNLTRPVLIAAIAGVVAISAIAVAAWRLSSLGGPFPGMGPDGSAVTGSSPAPASSSSPPSSAGLTASPSTGGPAALPPSSGSTPQGEAGAPTPSVASQPHPSSGQGSIAGLRGAAAPQAPGGEPQAAGARRKPSFDVVRIDPAGEAVIAGRAEPRAQVALTLSGKPVAQAQADADGQFVMIPPKLPSGDHVLGLTARGASGETTSEQTVAIAVPSRGERETVAALTAPDKPTVVLSQPAAPAGASSGDLRIATVEAQQGGALFATGVAPPGSTLRLYLNEAYVASVDSGADGKWSVRVERGMTPGGYRVRADRVGPDGRPLARVEAPFDYPAELARTAPGKPATVAAAASDAAAGAPKETAARPADAQNAVVDELRTARVERGDSLWRISRSIYGEGMRYTQIYDANSSQIRNPDLIYPGQVLVVPKQDGAAPPATPERRR